MIAFGLGSVKPGLALCHVFDHADEVDGTIAFGSRGVVAPAIPLQTKRNSGPTRSSPAIINQTVEGGRRRRI
jgi:hypothetical protein